MDDGQQMGIDADGMPQMDMQQMEGEYGNEQYED